MRASLLKVFNDEHLIFTAFFLLNRLDVIIQTKDDIFSAIRDCFIAERMQHSFQVGESTGLSSAVQMKSPLVLSYQIGDDNFTAKFTGGFGFVIPAQSPEDVDHLSLRHFPLILMQLFKCTQDIRFADFRKIIIFQ